MKWQNLPPFILSGFIVPHLLKLCRRYKTPLTLVTKANPSLPYGGLPFAPKNDLLDLFEFVAPYSLLKKQVRFTKRLEKAESFGEDVGYPLVMKPNWAHRGVGVRLIENSEDLFHKLKEQKSDYLLQKNCSLEYEFEVFYYRMPGEPKGTVFALKQKMLPVFMGNGLSNLRNLILHSGINNKKSVLALLSNKELGTVLPSGYKYRTLVCASHLRGAKFFDRRKWITPDLEKSIDMICNKEGLHFVRLDLKSRNVQDLKNGHFVVVGANGSPSDFTPVWNGKFSIKHGRDHVKKQWELLFEIAYRNRKREENDITFGQFCRQYIQFVFFTQRIMAQF